MSSRLQRVGALAFAVLMVTSMVAGTAGVSAAGIDGIERTPETLSTSEAPATSLSGPVSTQTSGTGSEQPLGAERTYEVTNSGQSYYNLDGYEQPSITLVRGKTYTFNVDASGHPFHISTDSNGGDFSGIYADGVSVTNPSTANDNATETGTLTFTVPLDAPATLYYQCGFHSGMGATITVVDQGDGSEANPYVITNASELQDMNTNLTASYVLGNDIDASGIANFDPIGTRYPDWFIGTFDGANYTISNLTIDRPGESNVGLFGSVGYDDGGTGDGAVIENVGVVNANVTGIDQVGPLAGLLFSGTGRTATVSNSYATGNVTGASGPDVGGLVGENNDGMVANSYATSSVHSSGDNTGGLVGFNTGGTVSSSYATGGVTGNGRTGGLVGNLFDGTVADSYATGSVTGDNDEAGGLVGYHSGGTVSGSNATGDVTGGGAYTGGLVGRQDSGGAISESYATGNVTGGLYTGGLTGSSFGTATVERVYAVGAVNGTDDVGGLVGYFGYTAGGSTIEGAYAAGAVTGNTDVGGLIGFDYGTGTVTDAYWDTETTGQASSPNGTGLTTAELKGSDAETNTNLDFTTNWSVVDTSTAISYPYLQANTQEPAPGLESLPTPPFAGNGTAEDPYQIGNWSQLDSVREYLDASFTLVVDLNETTADYDDFASETANSGAGWQPIGVEAEPFTGSFDGANYTVSDLTVDRPSTNYVGIIGYVGTSGVVENVGVVDADVTGNQWVGGLAGWNNGGAVSTSYVTGSVTGDSKVGGLVGINYGSGTVSDSHATAIVTNNSTGSYYGGLVGENQADISGSYATGSVTGDLFTGGLVGSSPRTSSTVSNSYATGDVTGTAFVGGLSGSQFGPTSDSYATGNVTGDDKVGGLAGRNTNTVDNSYATGNVTQRDGSLTSAPVGGLVGQNTGTVSGSYATGSVTGSAGYIGGLVGWNTNTVDNSYATGSVNGPNYVGGLVGYHQAGTIERAYAAGAVTGTDDFGGLVGFNDATISEAYWDTNTTGQASSSGGGTSLTTAELKGSNATTNTNLNFTANWDVVDTSTAISYPYLQSNTQEPAPGLESLAPFPGGFGTVADPFQIGNWSQLDSVREYPDASFTLVNDLNETTADYDTYANTTANGGAGWQPIGNATSPFTGSFDGANYTISDLTVDRPTEDEIGLFGTVDSAGSVGNVVLDNLSVVGRSNVGGFVGNATGSAPIEHVHITGAVNATGDTKLTNNDIDLGGVVGTIQTTDIQHATTAVNVTANIGDDNQQHIGGLVGFADQSDIHNVSTSGAVTVNGSAEGKKTGGLVGYITDGNISDSDTEGSVTATNYVGGLAGQFTGDNANPDRYMITNSSATGEISALGQAGGLVGQADYLNINGSSVSGHVTVSDADAGGLVGLASSADIVNSSSTGNVNATQNSGGLIGIAQSTVIVNSSADGDVTIDELSNSDVINAGGLVGQLLDTDIVDSSATGNLRGTKQIGGLVGLIQSGDIDNSTASGDVNGIESTGPFGKIESQSLGGLVGLIQGGNVTDSTANGDVAGAETAGGLVGKLNGPITITRSHASGDVTGNGEVTENEIGRLSGNSTFGGLIGSVESGTVVDSSATGSVAGRQNIGGLVGSNLDQVTGSYATGTVSGDNNVGGLVGVSTGNVSDSYATGAVSGNQFVGGALGLNIGKITHAYAAGAVTGTDSTGGLVGNASVFGQTGTTQSSYWDTRTTGQSTSAGNATGLTTLDLKGSDAEANTNLDFATTWSVLNNESHISYPYLQANTQEPAPGITTVSSGGNNGNGGNGDGSSGRSSGGSSSGSSGGSSGGADPQSVVSVSPVTDPDDDRTDGDSSTRASGDGDRPGAAAQAVSVRNVDPGERVAIVFESPDSEESTTDDETTLEGARPTEEPGDGAEPGEASRTSLRNVVPDGLDITFKRSGDYDLEVSSRDIDVFDRAMDDSNAPAAPDLSIDALDDDGKRFVSETNQRPVGFIEVDTKFDSGEVVEEATHKFRVRKSYLAATGASVESVRLYRDEADGWRSLPTRQTDEDEAFYYFEADTPGFSVFAIGTSSPVFETGAASLDSFDETTGEFEATVPVENVGDAPGEFEATLTADGAVVATETVALEANATTDLTLAGSVDEPGSVTLRLAGQSIGAVTRLDDGAPTAEGDADAASQADGDGTAAVDADDADDDAASGLGASLAGLVLVLALGLFLFAVWRRRDDEEEEAGSEAGR